MWAFGGDASVTAREGGPALAAADIEPRQVTIVVNGEGQQRTIITDSRGTRVFDEFGANIHTDGDGADHQLERVSDYGLKDGGRVIPDSIRLDNPDNPGVRPDVDTDDHPDPLGPDHPDPPDRPDPDQP
jgi:hypothetical protein